MLNKTRLLTPGPTPIPEEVRLALAKDMIHHRKPEFKRLMAKTQANLKMLFGTQQPVLPLASSGTGAMTAAVYSIFAPGEKVLVIEAGKFGQRWQEIAESRALDSKSISLPWGLAIEPEQVAEYLKADPEIRGILIQLSETSTGALMPVKEIAAITRETDTMLVVDGISGVGISPAPMDKWGIDCLVTGSQKGLMLPPGLALIALSERAWEKACSITPGCYYFNLPKERENIEKNQTNFTSPINLITGLDVSLNMLLKDGLDAVYKKQWALTMLVRAGIEAMGLKPFVEKHFSWGLTSIKLPAGADGQALLACANDKYGVVMAGGQDNLKGKIIRLGHMGWVDWSDCLAGLCSIVYALKEQNIHVTDADFVSCSMNAYEKALNEWPRTSQ